MDRVLPQVRAEGMRVIASRSFRASVQLLRMVADHSTRFNRELGDELLTIAERGAAERGEPLVKL